MLNSRGDHSSCNIWCRITPAKYFVFFQIHFHGINLGTLHAMIHKEVLPAELGGMEPPYNNQSWATQLTGDDNFSFSDKHIYWPNQSQIKLVSISSSFIILMRHCFPLGFQQWLFKNFAEESNPLWVVLPSFYLMNFLLWGKPWFMHVIIMYHVVHWFVLDERTKTSSFLRRALRFTCMGKSASKQP